MKTGVSWYIGCPASGKTTLARAHAIQAQRENGWPILVIDTEGVMQLRGFHHARSLRHVTQLTWAQRKNAARIPDHPGEVEALMRCCRDPGRVNLIVDEAHVWFDANHGGELRRSILRLMRSHRHAKVRLFLTTQHLSGDIPQAALACSPVLHVFRCTSPATLDRLEKSFGIKRSFVEKLPQFHFLTYFEGFPT